MYCGTATVVGAILVLCSICACAETYDAIVVGSGAGGLGSAAYLAHLGKRVLLLEKGNEIGGYMKRFQRTGGDGTEYTFEASLHTLNSVADPNSAFYKPLNDLGFFDAIKLRRTNLGIAKFMDSGTVLDLAASFKTFAEAICELSASDCGGVKKVFSNMQKLFEEMKPLFMVEDHDFFERFLDKAKFIIEHPDVIHSLFHTTDDTWTKDIHSGIAKAAFGFLWPYLGLPGNSLAAYQFNALMNSYYEEGSFFPEGGSSAVAAFMANYVKEHGGTVLLEHEVTKIELDSHKHVNGVTAVNSSGTFRFSARSVVCNAAVSQAIEMVGEKHFTHHFVRKVKKLKPSLTYMPIYVGLLDQGPLDRQLRGKHSAFVYNSNDFEKEYSHCHGSGNFSLGPYIIYNYKKVWPDCAPGNRSSVMVALMTEKGQWPSDSAERKVFKQRKTMEILRRVGKDFPGFYESIDWATVTAASPYDLEYFSNQPGGAVLGAMATPHQSNPIEQLQNISPIKGLYFAGQWVFPAPGQSSGLLGGIIAAKAAAGGYT